MRGNISNVPVRFRLLLAKACEGVGDGEKLGSFTERLYATAWEQFLCWRPPEDGGMEHELFVLATVMKLGQDHTPAERRMEAAIAILHDTHFIPRVMEVDLRAKMLTGAAFRSVMRWLEYPVP